MRDLRLLLIPPRWTITSINSRGDICRVALSYGYRSHDTDTAAYIYTQAVTAGRMRQTGLNNR